MATDKISASSECGLLFTIMHEGKVVEPNIALDTNTFSLIDKIAL